MNDTFPDSVFKSAVDSTSTGVVVTDYRLKDNPIVYANPFFESLTGYRRDEIIGQNCRFLQGPASDKQVVAKIRAAIESESSFRGDLLNYRKDGSTFWSHLTISPVKSSSGRTEHFVGIQHDITAEKSAEMERDLLIQKLRTINAGLQRFAATTSHELKNPLAILIGFSDQLKTNHAQELGGEGLRLLERISVNAKFLNQCLEDLRQLGVLGNAPLATELIGVSSLVAEAILVLGANSERGYVHFDSSMPEIRANRQLMVQVFRNLLENAVKYGQAREKGVFVAAIAPSALAVEIIVRDHGPGIEPELLPKIFDPFVTSDRSPHNSTGLGLPIVKKIIELHGGTIECRSSSGGTTFLIRLPNVVSPPITTAIRPSSPKKGGVE